MKKYLQNIKIHKLIHLNSFNYLIFNYLSTNEVNKT